jgi:hypothetical protein
MALHSKFPVSPYAPPVPGQRWFPADESLRATTDATAAEENGQRYDFVFVDQNGFNKHAPKTFAALAASFMEYRS